MANYSQLKQSVKNVIKQNGQQEITGDVLQSVLLSMITNLGMGDLYAGLAIPSTNPGTPDSNVFYIAVQQGTYTNFGGLTVGANDGLTILAYNGTWTKTATGTAGTGSGVWAVLSEADGRKDRAASGAERKGSVMAVRKETAGNRPKMRSCNAIVRKSPVPWQRAPRSPSRVVALSPLRWGLLGLLRLLGFLRQFRHVFWLACAGFAHPKAAFSAGRLPVSPEKPSASPTGIQSLSRL